MDYYDDRHRKLEAILEIMDCYLIDSDGYKTDISIHKRVETVANNYILEYSSKPSIVDQLIQQALIILDAYISDPSKEPKHIKELYQYLERK